MIYQNVIERLLSESKYDSFASLVSRRVLRLIKDSIQEINAAEDVTTSDGVTAKEFTAKTEVSGRLGKSSEITAIKLPVQVIVQRGRRQDSVSVTATAPQGQILFQVKVFSRSGTLLPIHLSLIQEKLYEAARHELEHLFQEEDPSTSAAAYSFFEKPHVMSRRLAYYTHAQETPAFVAGMYMRAKKMRKPFSEVVEDNLEKIRKGMLSRGNTPEQADRLIARIRKSWMSYAKMRYSIA